MKKLLILEDEEVLGKIYKKKLTEAGFNVAWAKSIQEAENSIKSNTFDLYFLDQGIAGEEKTGLDIIPIIKETNPKAHITMLSNYSNFQLEQKSIESGASDYLLKIDTPPKKLVEYANKLFS